MWKSLQISLIPKGPYTISSMKNFYLITGENEDFMMNNLTHIKSVVEGKEGVWRVEGSTGVLTTCNLEEHKPLLYGIINSIVYMNSKDPDIELLRPIREYGKKSIAKMEDSKRESLATIPVRLLSWSFHGRVFSKDETSVKPHLRWQPCGPNRSQVKLSWVRGHTRKYNKSLEVSESEA